MLRDLFSLFPAYAGVIPLFFVNVAKYMAFPRIRGGDPYIRGFEKRGKDFSPHTRG